MSKHTMPESKQTDSLYDGKGASSVKEHIELSRRVATEGMVLLKNDNRALPLEKGTKIAIFGKAQIDYVRGGGGSGMVYCHYGRNIYDGFALKEAEGKVSIFHRLSDFYKTVDEPGYEQLMHETYKVEELSSLAREPEISRELVEEAREFTDTAIVTISRYSGEGWDRSADRGDFYLSHGEEKMVNLVCGSFSRVIAVLNVGGVVDTAWFKDNPKIQGALLAWNPGMEGGLAVADIICGDVNPSGRLTDTFAASFEDYPSSETFNQSDAYVKYYEDIYVGYRYFETIKGAADKVNYPFGYGLSYTDFALSDISVTCAEGNIKAEVCVTNTGNMAGREVVQLYYSAPWGKLGKPARELAAFEKTPLLMPGQARTMCLEFAVEDMASYDDTGKVRKSAYVLEKGDYTFHIGSNVRSTVTADFVYTVSEKYIVTRQLAEKLAPTRLEKRLLSDGSYEDYVSAPGREPEYSTEEAPYDKTEGQTIMFSDVSSGKATIDEFVNQLTPEYMAEALGGRPSHGVANTGGIGGDTEDDVYAMPCVMTCDGPAGIRILPDKGVNTTCFPCATLVACTWDTELMYEVGRAGAEEAKENGLGIWLTPGMNIHRNPLCGRNFEYYSEDPLIAGKMAAAKVRGIQSQKVKATPKHFAANNKETNRRDSDSILSERALREIYLRGFEICVRESAPGCIMTSYNLINGTRSSESHQLITEILRGEWGFDGVVMTDWGNFGNQGRELLAGNDIRMPCGDKDAVLAMAREPRGRKALRESVKRVVELVLDTDCKTI